MTTVGLLVNPVAGLGGTVGLKGTDGPLAEYARRLGAAPRATARAALALSELASRSHGFSSAAVAVGQPEPAARRDDLTLVTVAGDMGADAAAAAGVPAAVVSDRPTATSAADTARAVRAMIEAGAQLLLFAGGDGTARDVLDASGERLPVIGIPAGVKIHSAVYAVNPRAAGEVAAAFLAGTAKPELAEVLDRQDGETTGTVLYGHMPAPRLAHRMQHGKIGSTVTGGDDPAGIAAHLLATRKPDGIDILGPGTTTGAVLAALGVTGPPTGVTVVDDSGLVSADADAATLFRLVERRRARVVVSPIGGQGFILGRGNQQLTPGLLRGCGRDGIMIISGETKLAALSGRPLLVDTGDTELDNSLHGYLPVVTGRDTTVMYRIGEK